jgi:hypothetical protein
MGRTDHRNLIDRGRKAGLNTREIYQALAGRRPDDRGHGQADGNGYVAGIDASGHRVFRPGSSDPRG